MKKRSFKLLLMLPFVVLLIMGCGGCRNSISAEKITGAVKGFEECMDACDRMESQYLTEYNNCLTQCNEIYLDRVTICIGTIPPGPMRAECISDAKAVKNSCMAECTRVWETHLAEIKNCKAVCIKRISILAE